MREFPEPCLAFNDLDKKEWEPGPWIDEPDKVQWVDPATGLDCLIVRSPQSGHLCGYVGVEEEHWAFGVSYSDLDLDDSPHGGLTFSNKCDEGGRLCHIPFPGRPGTIWWLGFDCAHCYDVAHFAGTPEIREIWRGLHLIEGCAYRDIDYVRHECEKLAMALTRSPSDGADTGAD